MPAKLRIEIILEQHGYAIWISKLRRVALKRLFFLSDNNKLYSNVDNKVFGGKQVV